MLRTIFSHLRTNQSAAQEVRNPSMQTSGNGKVNEPHGVELPSRVLPTCLEQVLSCLMEHYHEEKMSETSFSVFIANKAFTPISLS